MYGWYPWHLTQLGATATVVSLDSLRGQSHSGLRKPHCSAQSNAMRNYIASINAKFMPTPESGSNFMKVHARKGRVTAQTRYTSIEMSNQQCGISQKERPLEKFSNNLYCCVRRSIDRS
ncbi:hypothetical protein BCAR13_320017 [Paraburkholderia caribensis]|nr:hypothetical protein BCAR13_320017 [Paraburkholderia caribensis]